MREPWAPGRSRPGQGGQGDRRPATSRGTTAAQCVGGAHTLTATRGQALVEFALIAPVLLTILLAIIGSAWIFFQYEALSNAAQSAAREALIETSLLTATGCASGVPMSIPAAAQRAAGVVPVDPQPLCQSATQPTELVQAPGPAGSAVITITAHPGLGAGQFTSVTATVGLTVQPIARWTALSLPLLATVTVPAN